jgi:hypothetical protein
MGAERVELFKRQVSRRSVIGAGAKLAYASPLVVASFTLSPASGYVPAAAYFAKSKRAKKPSPQPGSRYRRNPSSEAQPTPNSTDEPCAGPTTGVAKPGATGGNAGPEGKDNGNKTKNNADKNGQRNGRKGQQRPGNGNKAGSGRHQAGGGADCGDPQPGGSRSNGRLHGKGNSGGGGKPGGKDGQGSGGTNPRGGPHDGVPDTGGAPTEIPRGEGGGPKGGGPKRGAPTATPSREGGRPKGGGASKGGTDPTPPSAGSPKLPPVGSDGHVQDGLTPTEDTGDNPTVSIAKVAICHAVCTKSDPHRPLAYRLIEVADDPKAWDRHVSEDHGQGTCAKDEDVVLGPTTQGFTEKDCPGNRISGP